MAVRAVDIDRIQRTLSHSTDTAALRKLCGLLEHVRGVWVGPPSWMQPRSLPPPARRSRPSGPRSPIALRVSATAADAALAQQLHPTPGCRHNAPRARAARRARSL
eukprot:2548074-Pleurochrysis_carterae.AAC.1